MWFPEELLGLLELLARYLAYLSMSLKKKSGKQDKWKTKWEITDLKNENKNSNWNPRA